MAMARAGRDWRQNGVRVVTSERLDFNTPQTPGMTRAAAINRATAGAEKLVRSDQEPVAVNLDIPAVEEPEEVRWIDPIHRE